MTTRAEREHAGAAGRAWRPVGRRTCPGRAVEVGDQAGDGGVGVLAGVVDGPPRVGQDDVGDAPHPTRPGRRGPRRRTSPAACGSSPAGGGDRPLADGDRDGWRGRVVMGVAPSFRRVRRRGSPPGPGATDGRGRPGASSRGPGRSGLVLKAERTSKTSSSSSAWSMSANSSRLPANSWKKTGGDGVSSASAPVRRLEGRWAARALR